MATRKKATQRRRDSSSLTRRVSTQLRRLSTKIEKFTHDIIDPYCTVNLSTTGKTQTTKPVRDGGPNTTWTEEHNNVLSFEYSFVKSNGRRGKNLEEKSSDSQEEDRGSLFFDIFDQDLIMDAHIGGNQIRLDTILNKLLADGADDGKDHYVKEQPLEMPLYRKIDGEISGFLRTHIRFEKKGTRKEKLEHTARSVKNIVFGHLIVTIEAGFELWDPNSEPEWIPTDSAQGRSVCVSFVICLIYFIGGSMLFVWIEGWNFTDSMYFGAATFTTVGYGSPAPVTDAGRLAACVFMIFGVTMVSVSIVRLWLAMINQLRPFCKSCAGQTKKICCPKKNKGMNQFVSRPEIKAAMRGSLIHGSWQDEDVDEALQNPTASSAEEEEEEEEEEESDTEKERESAYEQPQTLLWVSIIAAVKILGLVLFGTFFYMIAPGEELTFVESVYLSTSTVMTVGYGDLAPKTQGGRVVATIWMTLSYVILLRALQSITNTVHEQRLHHMRTELLNRDLGRKAILNMDKNGDGLLSRLEFISHMVVALKLCTPQHLQTIMERFDEIEHSREARVLVMNELAKLREMKSTLTDKEHDWERAKQMTAVRRQGTTVLKDTVKGAQILHDRETAKHRIKRGSKQKPKRRASFIKHAPAKDSDCILVDIGDSMVTEEQKEEMIRSDVKSPRGIQRNPTLGYLNLAKVHPASSASSSAAAAAVSEPTRSVKMKARKPLSSADDTSKMVNGSGPAVDVDVDVDPEDRSHPLSKMLAYMRRARDISRVYVQEQAMKTDKTENDLEHARIAIRAYRDLLESLHRQQTFAHDLLHPMDPEVLRLHDYGDFE